jgi:hypothetical protein
MWSFLLALAVFVGGAAAAQEMCADHKQALEYFMKSHNERPTVNAVMDSGAVLQILTSPNGATWTMLIVRPDGKSCLIASGSDWQTKATGA